ncbi:MAG: hypothetical protein ACOC56_03590, partial [Atribacterota bacterium]
MCLKNTVGVTAKQGRGWKILERVPGTNDQYWPILYQSITYKLNKATKVTSQKRVKSLHGHDYLVGVHLWKTKEHAEA